MVGRFKNKMSLSESEIYVVCFAARIQFNKGSGRQVLQRMGAIKSFMKKVFLFSFILPLYARTRRNKKC